MRQPNLLCCVSGHLQAVMFVSQTSDMFHCIVFQPPSLVFLCYTCTVPPEIMPVQQSESWVFCIVCRGHCFLLSNSVFLSRAQVTCWRWPQNIHRLLHTYRQNCLPSECLPLHLTIKSYIYIY